MNTWRRSVGTLSASAVLLVVGAGVASAHVTVAAPGVTAGSSDATITFRVPDESATASTVALKVQLPLDHPIAGVLVAPVTGWSAKITSTKLTKPITTDDGTITEAVSEIDWSAAAGAGIAPGFYGSFSIIAGQLPDGVNSLTFKALQTYSDNKVVSWIEIPAPGSTDEPDHPAPVLHLPAGTDDDSSSAAPSAGASASAATAAPGSTSMSSAADSGAASDTASAAAPDTTTSSDIGAVTVTAAPPAVAAPDVPSKGSVTTALVIGVVGVVVGIAGVGLALAGRRRRTPTT